MERETAWKKYGAADKEQLERLAAGYISFISENKTERECAASAIELAEAAGYLPLDEAVAEGRALKPGDKLWAHAHGKALILVHVGSRPFADGMNILGAHIDSPRLDLKQNPLYESNGFALLDTHYYGGIKNYQWVALPLALHGVVAKTDGSVVRVSIGEDSADPVFCVTDLLPHLGAQQMDKKGAKVVEGEDLDLLVGNAPLAFDEPAEGEAHETACATEVFAGESAESPAPAAAASAAEDTAGHSASKGASEGKDPVKAHVLAILAEKYGIAEEDFLSAELEVVPAGPARELGFDRSMVIGYGQDDRVCAYTSLMAQLALAGVDAFGVGGTFEERSALAADVLAGASAEPAAESAESVELASPLSGIGSDAASAARAASASIIPEKTAVTVLVDKEEIGSVGATGMESMFFENTVAEVMELAGEGGMLPLRRALAASCMLSSDVSAGFDPAYAGVFEAKNSAFLGKGLVFNKYTGARGKSGSNDASAEYMARIRRVMDDAGVSFQTAELGRVDAGGGGTIAYIPAKHGMNVIDSGVAVLSMHAPWEVTSKADIYEAFKGYGAFLRGM